jgi:hypothetical protein
MIDLIEIDGDANSWRLIATFAPTAAGRKQALAAAERLMGGPEQGGRLFVKLPDADWDRALEDIARDIEELREGARFQPTFHRRVA